MLQTIYFPSELLSRTKEEQYNDHCWRLQIFLLSWSLFYSSVVTTVEGYSSSLVMLISTIKQRRSIIVAMFGGYRTSLIFLNSTIVHWR